MKGFLTKCSKRASYWVKNDRSKQKTLPVNGKKKKKTLFNHELKLEYSQYIKENSHSDRLLWDCHDQCERMHQYKIQTQGDSLKVDIWD